MIGRTMINTTQIIRILLEHSPRGSGSPEAKTAQVVLVVGSVVEGEVVPEQAAKVPPASQVLVVGATAKEKQALIIQAEPAM